MRKVRNIVQVESMAARTIEKMQPVTISYVRADGSETVRTIEPFETFRTKSGDILIRAMDRATGQVRSWRMDRVLSYTIHRTRFTVPQYVSLAA